MQAPRVGTDNANSTALHWGLHTWYKTPSPPLYCIWMVALVPFVACGVLLRSNGMQTSPGCPLIAVVGTMGAAAAAEKSAFCGFELTTRSTWSLTLMCSEWISRNPPPGSKQSWRVSQEPPVEGATTY